eukprot:12490_1
MASEVEETLKRMKQHKGVEAVIIVNKDGVPIRPSKTDKDKGYDDQTAKQYATHIMELTQKARAVIRDLDPTNDLNFLRIRSEIHEIIVATYRYFTLIVIQHDNASDE